MLVPDAASYSRWLVTGLYVLVSWHLFVTVRTHPWILTIVRDHAVRMAHAIEHATISVLVEDGAQPIHGFTHGRDRFVVAFEHGCSRSTDAVRDSVQRAVQRIGAGEHALAYQPGCGTSEVVSAAVMWLAFATTLVCSLVVGSSPALSWSSG